MPRFSAYNIRTMPDRSAYVYLTNKGVLIVVSQVKTTDGLSRIAPPITVLPTQEPLTLGQAVLAALAASGKVIPHPTDWAEDSRQSKLVFAPLFKAAKVTSWTGVQRHCALISIRESAGEFFITVWERSSGQSYAPSDIGSRQLPDRSPLSIGAEIIQAFIACNERESSDETFPE